MDKKKHNHGGMKESVVGQNFSAEDSSSNLKSPSKKHNPLAESSGNESVLQDSGSSV